MRIIPITLKDANKFVVENHRHHDHVQGHKFALGLAVWELENECLKNKLIGAAICGRVNGRIIDQGKSNDINGLTLEATRTCVLPDVENGNSMLLGACARVAKELGYNNIITYTLMSERGVSLKAAGWIIHAENVGGQNRHWNSSGKVVRTAIIQELYGEREKYPSEPKRRWIKILNPCV